MKGILSLKEHHTDTLSFGEWIEWLKSNVPEKVSSRGVSARKRGLFKGVSLYTDVVKLA